MSALAVWVQVGLVWLVGLAVAAAIGVWFGLHWWVAALLFGFVSLALGAALMWLCVFVLLAARLVRKRKT